MTLLEAEGLADLGMWQEAWEALEAIPAEERAVPRSLRVRLRCCPALGAWEIGKHVAGVLRDGDPADRATAANFYHQQAVLLAKQQQSNGAKEAVAAAVQTWPDCRITVLDDPALSDLFR